METQKVILTSVFFFLSYLLWNSWYDTFPERYQTKQEPQAQIIESDVPSVPVVAAANTNGNNPNSTDALNSVGEVKAQKLITVTTDVVEYKINQVGGDIVQVRLLKFNKSNEDKTPINLLNSNNETLYIAPNGLTGEKGPDTQASRAEYSVEKLEYNYDQDYNKDTNSLQVNLVANGQDNTKFIKSFVFYKEKYTVDVEYKVINNGTTDWNGHLFSVLKRKNLGSTASFFSPTAFTGLAAYSVADKFHKITPDSLNKNQKVWSSDHGWSAMIQHYFLSAWVPASSEVYQYTAKANQDGTYSVNLLSPSFVVKPGETKTKSIQFYAGPEQADNLTVLAPGLERTVDYGLLWPISNGIFWGMKKIYNYVGNWGYAIILVTLLIKLLFYRLASSSYRSMAKMKILAPKIEQLKARYGEDREKMGKAMMELYKKEKVNPLGGCLPMLIQLPFFIALYWVIIESVELRQAPFVWWITDLSVKDPYFVLPVLMGLSMLAQQKLSPAPADPTQAKVMMMLPVVFTVMFVYFPAGLVLYWVVNTIASIVQQWWITKTVDADGNYSKKNDKNKMSNKKMDIKKIDINKKAMNDG